MKAVCFCETDSEFEKLKALASSEGFHSIEARNPAVYREGMQLDLNFQKAFFLKPYLQLSEFLKLSGIQVAHHSAISTIKTLEEILSDVQTISQPKSKTKRRTKLSG
jgi:hypothetical protein